MRKIPTVDSDFKSPIYLSTLKTWSLGGGEGERLEMEAGVTGLRHMETTRLAAQPGERGARAVAVAVWLLHLLVLGLVDGLGQAASQDGSQHLQPEFPATRICPRPLPEP